MAYNFVPCDRNQSFLMPPSLDDWLPKDHLVRFVIAVVETLDLPAFYARRRVDGWGRAAYDPKMMVALLIYAYATGARSSRLIERRCVEDIAFRFITANECPDHATIARFARDHDQALADLFEPGAPPGRRGRAGPGGAHRPGLHPHPGQRLPRGQPQRRLDPGRGGADHRRSPGHRRGGRSAPRGLPRLRPPRGPHPAGCPAWPSAGCQGPTGGRSGPPPGGLRGQGGRPGGLHQANRQGPDRPQAQASGGAGQGPGPVQLANTTDPDSRTMSTATGGFCQGYNAQAIATEDQITIACAVTTEATDFAQLKPMVEQAATTLAQVGVCEEVGVVVADAGYLSEDNLRLEDDLGIELVIATKNPKRADTAADRPPRGRIPTGLSRKQRMERKLRTKRGRGLYRKRGGAIEAVFGQARQRGAGRFRRRGLRACGCEWRFEHAVHNLLKIRTSGKWTAPGAPPSPTRPARRGSLRSTRLFSCCGRRY